MGDAPLHSIRHMKSSPSKPGLTRVTMKTTNFRSLNNLEIELLHECLLDQTSIPFQNSRIEHTRNLHWNVNTHFVVQQLVNETA